jgi:hypothetical protein
MRRREAEKARPCQKQSTNFPALQIERCALLHSERSALLFKVGFWCTLAASFFHSVVPCDALRVNDEGAMGVNPSLGLSDTHSHFCNKFDQHSEG